MQYNDEALPTLSSIEEMARAYSFSLKQKGFVFINLEAEGKKLLVHEIFEILFKLRASYRALGSFMGANGLLSLTEEHIAKLRNIFDIEENKGYLITTNKTKCFLNTLSLETSLSIKLLLLSQKCDENEEIIAILIERAKHISKNLEIENSLICKK